MSEGVAGMSENRHLTFCEATAIITGYGIGGGVMTLPYLTTTTGLPAMLALLMAGVCISVLMHLMAAEILLRDGQHRQVVELCQRYLLTDKPAFLTWALFMLITFAFLVNLSAYIAGGGKILAELLGTPLMAGLLLFYAIAAGVMFFGLKALGLSEQYAVLVIVMSVAALAAGAARVPFSLRLASFGTYKEYLTLFGMIMFSLFAMFAVPQVAEGLSWNKKLIPKAITAGILVNASLSLTIVLVTVGVSTTVDEVAIISVGRALGSWASVVALVFVLCAVLTSYWSVSFALATVIEERLRTSPRVSWLGATLPGFLMVVLTTQGFLDYLSMASGAIAILVALMIVPLLNKSRRYGAVAEPEWQLGVWGGWASQVIVVAGFIAMAIGAIRPW